MGNYSESAYSQKQINEAVEAAGYESFKLCVATLTTRGSTLTQIAEELKLNPQRFWAYYSVWCRAHAEPLRLGKDDE